MGEEAQNIDALAIVMDSRDQAELVATYVEYCNCVAARHRYRVSVGVNGSHVRQVCPFCRTNSLIPSLQRPGHFRMFLGKQPQPFSGDDAHGPSLITLCNHEIEESMRLFARKPYRADSASMKSPLR
jgi:hypothetical protein